MNRPVELIALLAFSTSSQTIQASWQFGLAAQTAWSDNEYLGNPDGWGFHLTKSLAEGLNLQASYTHLDHRSLSHGTLPFAVQPPSPLAVIEKISRDALVRLYEISLSRAVFEGTKMRLELGGGMGLGIAQLELNGELSGHTVVLRTNTSTYSLNVQVFVKELIYAPLTMSLAYQTRKVITNVGATGGFEPFTDFTLSSVQLGLLVRF